MAGRHRAAQKSKSDRDCALLTGKQALTTSPLNQTCHNIPKLEQDYAMNVKTLITPALAGIGWLLTVILVMQLLSGTFDTRSCTTACFQILYWSAFAVTAVGLVVGTVVARRSIDVKTLVSLAALAVLMLIYLAMMFIGTFL